jgi:hypothetical protein
VSDATRNSPRTGALDGARLATCAAQDDCGIVTTDSDRGAARVCVFVVVEWLLGNHEARRHRVVRDGRNHPGPEALSNALERLDATALDGNEARPFGPKATFAHSPRAQRYEGARRSARRAARLQNARSSTDGQPCAVLRDQSWKIVQHTGLGEWFQSNFKLARQFGVMNLVVLHKLADLQAVGDAGSRAARIAEGLIADASTRIVYHQDESQVPLTRQLLGLSETEAQLISMLSAGQALWRVGSRSFVVQHYRSQREAELTNTDTGMRIAEDRGVRA